MGAELNPEGELKVALVAGEDVSWSEPDLPPEYCHYRDEGCDLAESCLNCPLPKCIDDEARGKQRWLKRRRSREMARLFTSKGKKIKELALMFGVSPRTVQRALKQALADSFTLTPNRNESPNLATGDPSQRGQQNG